MLHASPVDRAILALAAWGIGAGLPVAARAQLAASNNVILAAGSTTPRSAEDRAADIASVLDFGADKGGNADISTILQNLDATLSGRAIVLPPGNYLFNNTAWANGTNSNLVVSLGAKIVGSGAPQVEYGGTGSFNAAALNLDRFDSNNGEWVIQRNNAYLAPIATTAKTHGLTGFLFQGMEQDAGVYTNTGSRSQVATMSGTAGMTGYASQPEIGDANQYGSISGYDAQMKVDSGSDGQVSGMAITIDNNGSDAPYDQTAGTKNGYSAFAGGGTPSTIALNIGGNGSYWHTGIQIARAGIGAASTDRALVLRDFVNRDANGYPVDLAYLNQDGSATFANLTANANGVVGGTLGVAGTVTAPTFSGALSGNATTATTAGNVTGTVAIAHGGTGATSASAALTALGAAPLASPAFTGTVTANTLSSSAATITGGTINGTTLGATTASTGKFTTLTATGAASLQSTLAVTGAATLSSTLSASSHGRLATGTTPTVGSNACGSTTQGTISGTDQAFTLTVGTASVTSCTVTFGSAFATAPVCVFAPANAAAAAQGTTAAYLSSTSTTTFVLAGTALASTKYTVHCM